MLIRINQLRIIANHGVLQQERLVGNIFELNIELRLASSVESDAHSDSLASTVNYADIVELVKREMLKPSKLLENVAWRIASAIKTDFPLVESGCVEIVKVNPPCGVEVGGIGVELSF